MTLAINHWSVAYLFWLANRLKGLLYHVYVKWSLHTRNTHGTTAVCRLPILRFLQRCSPFCHPFRIAGNGNIDDFSLALRQSDTTHEVTVFWDGLARVGLLVEVDERLSSRSRHAAYSINYMYDSMSAWSWTHQWLLFGMTPRRGSRHVSSQSLALDLILSASTAYSSAICISKTHILHSHSAIIHPCNSRR